MFSNGEPITQLREEGIALLRDVFAKDCLARLREAAGRCFEAIGTAAAIPERYQFNRFSNSVVVEALSDFGSEGAEELAAPLTAPGLGQLFSEAMGPEWSCRMDQSWVRKKLAPPQARAAGYHLQDWHQDGGLGVCFPMEPGPAVAMTELLTCWIPLSPCGIDSPGLEFVRGRQPALVHFTELADGALQQRISPEEFWAPALEVGDGVVFLNSVLHRTYVRPEMRQDRMSVEYRIFPR